MMGKWAIGIDLGGTKIEVAIVNEQGQLHDHIRIPTESAQAPEQIIENMITVIDQLSGKHKNIPIATIGVGVAGQIEKSTGTVVYAPNLEWHHVPLQQQLVNALHIPVAVCNDVKAAAWGEYLLGAGVGSNNLVCIFVGTGIGGAIISNRKILDGCNNTAGEVGHIIIDMHGPVCHCGNKGCFEALAGGWAIQRDAQLAVQKDRVAGAMLLDMANGDVGNITAAMVTIAALQGDALAKSLIDNVVKVLVAGAVTVINMLGPDNIIFGGGVIEGMPQLIARVDEGIRKHALRAAIGPVKLLHAKLHTNSNATGAAIFALQMLAKSSR